MMETLIETVDLDMEESNELAFKIKVEGASNSPAKVRLVCESGEVAYMFNGRGTSEDGVVQFILPRMKDKLSEGIYQARVEVLVENRYFSPVQFQINFKKAVKVVAESLFVVPKFTKPEISVQASPVAIVKPAQQEKPAPVFEPTIKEQQVTQTTQPVVERKVEKRQQTAQQTTVQSKKSFSLKERYEQKMRQHLEEDALTEIARAYLSSKR